eukprot:1224962-Rhodomonas_salina.1
MRFLVFDFGVCSKPQCQPESQLTPAKRRRPGFKLLVFDVGVYTGTCTVTTTTTSSRRVSR